MTQRIVLPNDSFLSLGYGGSPANGYTILAGDGADVNIRGSNDVLVGTGNSVFLFATGSNDVLVGTDGRDVLGLNGTGLMQGGMGADDFYVAPIGGTITADLGKGDGVRDTVTISGYEKIGPHPTLNLLNFNPRVDLLDFGQLVGDAAKNGVLTLSQSSATPNQMVASWTSNDGVAHNMTIKGAGDLFTDIGNGAINLTPPIYGKG